jgi:DNA polymerase/3'-5' exonuclease PolX
MQLETLQPLAQSLLEQLASACVRLEIAGSVRRGKADPHDLELVALPAIGEVTIPNLFGEIVERRTVNLLENALVALLQAEAWEFDPEVKRNGPKYKRLRHGASGLCCDLFITDRRRWGYTFTVRTGPGDFSKALVKCAHRRGMFFNDSLLHKHAPVFDEKGNAKPCPAGETCLKIVATPEERDVFAALEIPWIEPGKRTVNLLYAVRPVPYRPEGR